MYRTIVKTLKNKVIKAIKIGFYKTMDVTCSMYGSEKWALTETDKKRIQTGQELYIFILNEKVVENIEEIHSS